MSEATSCTAESLVAAAAPLWWTLRTSAAVFLVAACVTSVGLIALVRHFTSRMCDRTPLLDLLDDSEDEQKKKKAVKDLEGIFAKQGLGVLWDKESAKTNGLRILMSGCTGYVGKTVLFELLRRVQECELPMHDDQKLILLVRQRKGTTAAERLAKIREDPIFDVFPDSIWDWVQLAESSGLENPNCGLSQDTLNHLGETKVTHIIHCAADVTFDRELPLLAASNIRASLQMQAFAREWDSCESMVYVSTAFVNPTCGSAEKHMPEELFSLQGMDPQALYESMIGDQELALKTKAEIGFQNNYVFSKCVGEHLLSRDTSNHKLRIVRPGIVGPSFVLPSEGWNGDRPSTATGFALLFLSRLARVGLLSSAGSAPLIPVDVVATGIVHAMLAGSDDKEDNDTDKISVKNFVFSATSPRQLFSSREMADAIGSWAVLDGLAPMSDAGFYHALSDLSEYIPWAFPWMHAIINRGPLTLFAVVQSTARFFGIELIPKLKPHKIIKYVDMVDGYKPFTARNFHFAGSLYLPESFNPNGYLLYLYKASEAFYSKIVLRSDPQASRYVCNIAPPGRFDLWWALTQPRGTFGVRLLCFFMAKWLRRSFGSDIQLDIRAMAKASPVIQSIQNPALLAFRKNLPSSDQRGWLDWALGLYVDFAYPMLGLKLQSKIRPLRYPVIPTQSWVFPLMWALCRFYRLSGTWPYAIGMYVVARHFSPCPDRLALVNKMVIRAVKGRFENMPLRFNLHALAQLTWGVFFRLPVEVLLWHLDEFLFPNYHNVKIEDPFFLVGQPRSGTTKFQDVLCEDQDTFCSLKLYEMRFPFLTVQYAIDFFANLDEKYLGNRLYAFLLRSELLYALPNGGERKDMRRLRYDLPDEDDLVFLHHCVCHFLLLGVYPDANMVKMLCQFKDLPESTRNQYMAFHKRAVQKVLYRRGNGRRYLAKWVACWNGLIDESKTVYPGGKYVTLVRDPSDQLPSWMKLQGLLGEQVSGNNFMANCPGVRKAVVDLNKEWFHKEIEFCKTTPREQLLVMKYSDFVQDIPAATERVYGFLGEKMSPTFAKALQAHKQQQSGHKKTVIRHTETFVTQSEIKTDFPNLLQEIEC